MGLPVLGGMTLVVDRAAPQPAMATGIDMSLLDTRARMCRATITCILAYIAVDEFG